MIIDGIGRPHTRERVRPGHPAGCTGRIGALKGRSFLQKGTWPHRLHCLKERLQQEGIGLTIGYYIHRIRVMLFAYRRFGRVDINVQLDARLGGTRNMQIGQRFGAGHYTSTKVCGKVISIIVPMTFFVAVFIVSHVGIKYLKY